ncbi:DUF4367 domain-containing protein [Heyndrickxia camelliae]|uniref:DUF4367 domain-containing protein n=1 Tax=Heyndrickxia camelliae TaxID=1707093 RepID=A0A2N3LJD9_9BACI|nr:DUF4367 domain-containing protein [Heyndrickxia camelliae]PKR84695.1 hypothetical protein CWO92_13395 [Heyndrickxia camelliae]
MKRSFITALMTVAFLVSGCSHDGLYRFNHKSLLAELKKSGFAPELPTELPFKVKSTNITEAPQPNNKIYTIDFHGTKGEYLSLQMVSNMNVKYNDDVKREKVKIGDIQGQYAKNKPGALMLNWNHNKIHYDMTYYIKKSKKKISKKAMIKTAESFN